ncbi:MAG TPA: PEP-CTERM sorting domain-containing protein [Cellvibrio sp.]|nr:PEP-CTERM sorting domain-containing protein [Cellvibrio sp.]
MSGFRFTAVALWAIAVGASAAPVVSLSKGNQVTTQVADAVTVDFNAGCGYASCSGNYKIVSGSLPGAYTQPFAIDSPYLSLANPSAAIHTAVFDLGTTANYFGLFWGSIDDYNSITFYRDNVELASVSGADIAGKQANGNSVGFASNRYVNFDFGNDVYDTVRLSSSNFAFESDNHAYKSTFVPEPVNLVLMALGVFCLGAARRMQRK